MKKIIINGASGLLGKALIDYLDKNVYNFAVIARNTGKAESMFPECKIIKYKDSLLPEIFEDYFAVINFAGASIGGRRWNDEYKKQLYSSRINTTKNIAYAVSRTIRKPSVFINASASGYYGFRDESPADESAAAGKDFLARLCSDWEDCTKEIRNSGVRTVILRTAVVLSKSAEATERLIKPFRYFAGGKLGSGKQPFPFIHIKDMIRIIEFILENDSIEGAVNCACPDRITNKEFSKITGKILHRPSIFTVPSLVLKILLDGFADSILKGRFIVPAKLISNDFKFEFADAESALNDILRK